MSGTCPLCSTHRVHVIRQRVGQKGRNFKKIREFVFVNVANNENLGKFLHIIGTPVVIAELYCGYYPPQPAKSVRASSKGQSPATESLGMS